MAKHKKIMASALRFVVHTLKNLFLPEFFFYFQCCRWDFCKNIFSLVIDSVRPYASLGVTE